MKTVNKPSEIQYLPMSYEEYLNYGDDTTRMEWVGEEAIVYMPPRHEHQRMIEFLHNLLSLFVQLSDLGLVRISPFEVKLWEDGPSREPDIFFIKKEQLHLLSSERFSGAPDLAVEIISPSSLYVDRDKKFREYERAGVREYWLLDSRPESKRADFYCLDSENRYQLFATEADEVVHSKVLESFWLRSNWLWKNPLPNPLVALAEIAGKDAILKILDS